MMVGDRALRLKLLLPGAAVEKKCKAIPGMGNAGTCMSSPGRIDGERNSARLEYLLARVGYSNGVLRHVCVYSMCDAVLLTLCACVLCLCVCV